MINSKDLREYKKSLRKKAKDYRKALSVEIKTNKDTEIFNKVISLYQYKTAKSLLCYVSTGIEVDTKAIIEQAFLDEKNVYVPRCVDNTRFMDFIKITSFDDLEVRTFGVLEPKAELTEKYCRNGRSICIIPALMYDFYGYRIGYGGGYYDRFLSGYKGFKVGVIYEANLTPRLRHGKFDVPANLLITERFIKRV